jgi:DNA-directed RNA polymerase subunit RPC12/RpoP
MSGRHQPLNGADSPAALLPIACLTCSDRGWVIGGDQLISCPACHGAYECGRCGRMTPAEQTSLLDAGTYRWRRCHRCRDADAEQARVAS